ncbi:hypothetical protein [Sphingobacterium sp. SGR-19]|uniref:hypothetical protein n=1 Tax=Sphingobacterium sp. SGR-19 TaxID=2710886 RepID=UPI0013EDC0E9|nr:hypothetical protein [Sphingobacterium sp. SGR-19]NGM66022.1 hypothetical protein [Sphingobacterium sp. SGR-19]
MTAYDLNKVPGKDAVLLYGKRISAYADTVKMTILFISPCGEAALPCAEVILLPSITNLPSFYVIALPNENKLLCSKVISAYDKMFVLGKGSVDSYADVKKMAGSFFGLGNETMSPDDDVTLLPIDRTLPSAVVILPSGLPTELSSVSVKIFLPRPLLLLRSQFLKGMYIF